MSLHSLLETPFEIRGDMGVQPPPKCTFAMCSLSLLEDTSAAPKGENSWTQTTDKAGIDSNPRKTLSASEPHIKFTALAVFFFALFFLPLLLKV